MRVLRFANRSPILLLLAVPYVASAGGDPTAYEFLRVPMSARAAALGNTFITMRGDPAVLFSNPGGLSSLPGRNAALGFLKYWKDIDAGFAAYTQEVEGIGWLAAGVTYVNYGTFDGYDALGNSTGTFGAADLAFTVGYGNRTENFTYGAAVKFVSSSIEQFSSTGLAVDIGAQYVIPDEQIVIGASMLNFGGEISAYDVTKDNLPFDVKIGVSKKLEHLPLTVGLNFHDLNQDRTNFFDRFSDFTIGGEIEFSPAFCARLGYDNALRKDLKIGDSAKLAGFSAGFGVTVSSYNFDYAFTSFGRIPGADNHRVTVRALL